MKQNAMLTHLYTIEFLYVKILFTYYYYIFIYFGMFLNNFTNFFQFLSLR